MTTFQYVDFESYMKWEHSMCLKLPILPMYKLLAFQVGQCSTELITV